MHHPSTPPSKRFAVRAGLLALAATVLLLPAGDAWADGPGGKAAGKRVARPWSPAQRAYYRAGKAVGRIPMPGDPTLWGSGMLVARGGRNGEVGFVLTANHVAWFDSDHEVVFRGKHKAPMTHVVHRMPELDLALIAVKMPPALAKLQPVQLQRDTRGLDGALLRALGYPNPAKPQPKLLRRPLKLGHAGKVTGPVPGRVDEAGFERVRYALTDAYQVDAPMLRIAARRAAEGMSGGPWFGGNKARVVGVTIAGDPNTREVAAAPAPLVLQRLGAALQQGQIARGDRSLVRQLTDR